MGKLFETWGRTIIVVTTLYTLSQAGIFNIASFDTRFAYNMVRYGLPLGLIYWSMLPIIEIWTEKHGKN